MRPAQKAPENRGSLDSLRTYPSRFNEAGAKSAGKRAGRQPVEHEARLASMRPAQKAPENLDPAAKQVGQFRMLQ